jgi:hypothetical protein
MLGISELVTRSGSGVTVTTADPGFVRTTLNKDTQGVMRLIEKWVFSATPFSSSFPLHALFPPLLFSLSARRNAKTDPQ